MESLLNYSLLTTHRNTGGPGVNKQETVIYTKQGPSHYANHTPTVSQSVRLSVCLYKPSS